MKGVWKVIMFMCLILAIGFSVAVSANGFDTADQGSISYKLRHADLYIEGILNKVLSYLGI